MTPEYFKNQLTQLLLKGDSITHAFELISAELLEYAQAEAFYFLLEDINTGEWYVSLSQEKKQFYAPKTLLSHSALNKAIDSRKPLLLKTLVGHSISGSESIIGANLQSIAALPFFYENRAIACLFFASTDLKQPIRERVLDLTESLFPWVLASYFMSRTHGPTSTVSVTSPKKQHSIIFSKSSALNEVFSKLAKVAPSDLSILIRGETGTGKELLAREVHAQSHRNQGPFISLNITAIPSTLLESTLFGHKKGAFTGALQTQEGKFQKAHGGTLFLDEIGDLSFELQTKLLRVIQEKEVEMVGSTEPKKIDFRLVTATHQNLEQLVKQGRFREDLYYRLNGIALRLPPLCERQEDILPLAQYFLTQMSPEVKLSRSAQEALLRYSWPGNIRELEQMIRRASLLCSQDQIEVADLEIPSENFAAPSKESIDCVLLSQKKQTTDETVSRALAKANGNRSQAAKLLGVSERTLYRLISKLGADPATSGSEPTSLADSDSALSAEESGIEAAKEKNI